jgi:hypothetical protein
MRLTTTLILGLTALLFFSDCAVAQQSEEQAEPPKAAATDPLRAMIWDEALDAGTNVRYWSALSEAAAHQEWITGLLSLGLLLFSIAFPFVIAPQIKSKKYRWLKIGLPELVGIIGFGFSLMIMLDQSATHNELSSIQSRWAVLKPELDELFEISHTLNRDELALRFEALKKARQAIVPIEPAGKDELLMHRSWVQEMHSRGIDPEYIAQVEKNRTKLGLPN